MKNTIPLEIAKEHVENVIDAKLLAAKIELYAIIYAQKKVNEHHKRTMEVLKNNLS